MFGLGATALGGPVPVPLMGEPWELLPPLKLGTMVKPNTCENTPSRGEAGVAICICVCRPAKTSASISPLPLAPHKEAHSTPK